MAVVRIIVVTEGRSAMLDLEGDRFTVTAGKFPMNDFADFLRPYLERFLGRYPRDGTLEAPR